MHNRLALVLCILVGSFFVYCGQSVMTNLSHGDGGIGGGGPVGDAMAQSSGGGTCCTPPSQTFTKLGTGKFGGQDPTVSVAGYREVVVYSTCDVEVSFRADASSPYAGFVSLNGGGRVQVQGSDILLTSNAINGIPSCKATDTWVIAGVSN